MARKATWPPKPHEHAPSGQERVRWLGRDYYLGPIGSPEARAEYVKLIKQLEAERGPDGDWKANERKTVAQVHTLWRVYAIGHYGAGSTEIAEYDWAMQPLLDRWASEPAASIDVNRLDEAREAMAAAGLCRNVVNRRVIRVRTVWRWAERNRHVPPGSWSHLRALPPLSHSARNVRRTQPVRPAEWLTVAAVCRQAGPSVRGLVLSQWWTGARPGELFGLRVRHLTGRTGGKQSPVWLYHPEQHKCAWRDQQRVVAFGPRAQASLQRLLTGKGPDDLVFPNRCGYEYDSRSYYLAVTRAARRAGVKLHPYQIRHSARLRITREMGLDAARAMLGHRSLGTTNDYAAGQDVKTAADAARKLG